GRQVLTEVGTPRCGVRQCTVERVFRYAPAARVVPPAESGGTSQRSVPASNALSARAAASARMRSLDLRAALGGEETQSLPVRPGSAAPAHTHEREQGRPQKHAELHRRYSF